MSRAELTLVCKICRWRPPADLTMSLVQAHFDLEPDHDPEDVTLELVVLCRDGEEMKLDRSEQVAGGWKDHFSCPRCHRTTALRRNDTETP